MLLPEVPTKISKFSQIQPRCLQCNDTETGGKGAGTTFKRMTEPQKRQKLIGTKQVQHRGAADCL